MSYNYNNLIQVKEILFFFFHSDGYITRTCSTKIEVSMNLDFYSTLPFCFCQAHQFYGKLAIESNPVIGQSKVKCIVVVEHMSIYIL